MADTEETCVDASMQENNEDTEVVTMVDVLKEEQELEDDVSAVLGASDEKNCTYSKGYLKRQALYACVTCIPESKTDPTKRAGVCLACSYSCHENHELIELYTKRNFRCDCGNIKFPTDKKCILEPEKSEINEDNIYNHNFAGLYCTCERPYPDPEDNVPDDMIQCIMCEDWYHCRHLGIDVVPTMISYSEMICSNCVSNHEFLLNYGGYAVTPITAAAAATTTTTTDDSVDTSIPNIKVEADAESTESPQPAETVEKLNEMESSTSETTNENDCKMPKIRSELSAKFWTENWRQHLCTCKDCVEMYETQKISYLVDLQDTVHFYEEKGKAKALENPDSQYDRGMKALSSLDRVQQIEVVSEYNKMKDRLKEYLQKFADNKKIVREEDIREFFSKMTANKKAKVDIPYFCR